jgi:hypothetical protein
MFIANCLSINEVNDIGIYRFQYANYLKELSRPIILEPACAWEWSLAASEGD